MCILVYKYLKWNNNQTFHNDPTQYITSNDITSLIQITFIKLPDILHSCFQFNVGFVSLG